MFLDIPRICVYSVLTTFYQLQEFLSSASSLPFHHLGIFLLFCLFRFDFPMSCKFLECVYLDLEVPIRVLTESL